MEIIMKKLAVSLVLSLICGNIAFAENTISGQAPAKYELGQYSFDFSDKKEKATVEVKDIKVTPQVKTQTVVEKPQIQKSKDNFKMQKDIINQIKAEEKEVSEKAKEAEKTVNKEFTFNKENIKEEAKKVEEKAKETETSVNKEIKLQTEEIKKDVKKFDTELNKTENQIKKAVPKNQKNEKPINNKKKKNEKANEMPFQFKIMEMDVVPKETRTIEKL